MKAKLLLLVSFLSVYLLAQKAPNYYSRIDFSKKRNELKQQLATLIKNTHTHEVTYADLKWIFLESDRDPDNLNNVLFIYGSDNSEDRFRSKPLSELRGVELNKAHWDREHVYAQSIGIPQLGQEGPGSDAHHLRPAPSHQNRARGNDPFIDDYGLNAHKIRGGWYPGDEWRGDVARILMYLYVRYGNRTDPNRITKSSHTYSPDFPDILLKWNIEDPVSKLEKRRNEVVYNIQHNRNPFIDNPYLATLIWGGPQAENTWSNTIQGGGKDDIPPTAPTDLTATKISARSISLSWTKSTDNVGVYGYEVYVNNELIKTVYENNVIISDLTPNTHYEIAIIAFDSAKNKSKQSVVLEVVTTQNSNSDNSNQYDEIEDFENIPAENIAKYTDRTWTNNGITWTATDSRIDSKVYIEDSKAICIRKGSLKSSVISGGISSLSVKTFLPFKDKEGEYTLKINGEVKGKIPYSKTAQTYTINNINVAGDFTIELIDETSKNRVSFDNLSWTHYSNLATNDFDKNTKKAIVYPNPTKDNIVHLTGINKNETLNIYNINGKLVQVIKNARNNQPIELNNLSKGLYLIKTEKETIKLIVQ